MDWIERWFGVSPDGGDGSLEVVVALVLVVVSVTLAIAAFPGLRARLRRALRGLSRRTTA